MAFFEKKGIKDSNCATNDKGETICYVKAGNGKGTGYVKFVRDTNGGVVEKQKSIHVDDGDPATYQEIAAHLNALVKAEEGKL